MLCVALAASSARRHNSSLHDHAQVTDWFLAAHGTTRMRAQGTGQDWTLERFSKPNFGSIRRFRTMTGLEIENWIEKRGRTVRKFRSTRPRTESNFRFGLTSRRSQNLPSEVRSLLCQVFGSFSLVTSSSSHHASHLRGFIRSLTRPNWSFHSTRLTMNFFTSAGDFRQVVRQSTWPSSVNEWARDVGHGITSDRGLGRRSPPDLHSLTKNILWDTWGPRFSAARHQSSSAGHIPACNRWSIVFLFAERNFRLCVDRNFDTIFDPVLPEPNRIFGLLNLSIEVPHVRLSPARVRSSLRRGSRPCSWCQPSYLR